MLSQPGFSFLESIDIYISFNAIMNPSADNKGNIFTGIPVKKIVDDIFMRKLRKKRLLLHTLTNTDPLKNVNHLAGTI